MATYSAKDKIKAEIASLRQKADELSQPAVDPSLVVGTPNRPGQAPYVTSGPVGQDSKPFSMANLVVNGLTRGLKDEAKFEFDFAERFTKALRNTGCMLAEHDTSGKVWLPYGNIDQHFGHQITSNDAAAKDVAYCKAVMQAGTRPIDPDEAKWLVERGIIKAGWQSGYFPEQGGSLVAPPTQGPVIPLIRPNPAVVAAGASTMVLPPSGKYVEPRITSAPQVYSASEGGQVAQSNLGTGQFVLQARKVTGWVEIGEESSLFTSGTQDQWVQSELTRSSDLQWDSYALYGPGGTDIPKGVATYAGTGAGDTLDVWAVSAASGSPSKGIGPNGNTLLPQHGWQIPAAIMERSFGLDASEGGKWIMRPGTFASIMSQRTSAIQSNDKQGLLVNAVNQALSDSLPKGYGGYAVVQSTNVTTNGTKGTSVSTLTNAFWGLWKYMVFASYGAVSFDRNVINNQFIRGLSTVRMPTYGDVGLRYPPAFAYISQLLAPANID